VTSTRPEQENQEADTGKFLTLFKVVIVACALEHVHGGIRSSSELPTLRTVIRQLLKTVLEVLLAFFFGVK
jgi:hypothetical protein